MILNIQITIVPPNTRDKAVVILIIIRLTVLLITIHPVMIQPTNKRIPYVHITKIANIPSISQSLTKVRIFRKTNTIQVHIDNFPPIMNTIKSNQATTNTKIKTSSLVNTDKNISLLDRNILIRIQGEIMTEKVLKIIVLQNTKMTMKEGKDQDQEIKNIISNLKIININHTQLNPIKDNYTDKIIFHTQKQTMLKKPIKIRNKVTIKTKTILPLSKKISNNLEKLLE
jgi:hypothetical protein